MDDGQLIRTRTPESRALFDRVKVASRLSSKLSGYCLDEAESIQRVFEELIGKPVGDTFTLIPPFYTDYGLNITVGRAVFIGYECAFTGHAAINIADEVMIAHKVSLVTAGHPVEPDKRRAYITAEPITIETNVWIGAAATILPGVNRRHGAESRPPPSCRPRLPAQDGRDKPRNGDLSAAMAMGAEPRCRVRPNAGSHPA